MSELIASDSGSTVGCRPGCGACCIAPSITSPIPEMPHGKPAGVRCVHLDDHHLCMLFGSPQRPDVCGQFDYDPMVCGEHRNEALATLSWLEQSTR
ncbi:MULTISPECIES: YkgJ family cysteine cluster protein [Halomonadaceae]|uniref:YkgJ family cysteine cluster protein n=1 Tax=Halomonadaceae TaxID=28256 RepID=UPI001C6375EA|nr:MULTISPECIES: YkgJ family cysteine cluster protein [Halomonas]MCG7591207.1 YkgJ family cysteine cluster protein [Halomonas sp. McD50-5]MCG7617425.1 YkgJ family cysteine cluster protein [Halomonas sp. McD50-4]